jgi:two-component SAPR family response regulator
MLFLACQPAEGVARNVVTEALWQETEVLGEDSNHRFRQLRYRLRQRLRAVPDAPPTDGIRMDRRGFRLDPGVVHSDAQEFLTLVRDARLHLDQSAPEVIQYLERARALYAGDLFDAPDARRYGWLDERDDSGVTMREHFRRLFQNACSRLAEAYTSRGQIAQAIDVYHDLTEMDPSDERLFQALFRLRAQSGDISGLEAEEKRMRELLRELSADLDSADLVADEPDAETMQEYRRLLDGLRAQQREAAAV